MNWKKIFAGFAALALAMNGLGFYVGRWNSPRYDDELGAYAYLASEVRYVFDDTGLQSLELHAGLKKYTYYVDEDTLDISLRSAWELKNLTRPRNRILELDRLVDYVGLASLLPSGVTGAVIAIRSGTSQPPLLRKMTGTGSKVAARVYLPAVVIGASSGYLGYRFGYSDLADWENDVIQKVLRDKRYYRRIYTDLMICEIGGYDLVKKVKRVWSALGFDSPTIYSSLPHLRAEFHPSEISPRDGVESDRLARNSFDNQEIGDQSAVGLALNSPEFTAALEELKSLTPLDPIDYSTYCEAIAHYITEVGYVHPLAQLL